MLAVWTEFFRIWTEYEEVLRISLCLVQIWENTDSADPFLPDAPF